MQTEKSFFFDFIQNGSILITSRAIFCSTGLTEYVQKSYKIFKDEVLAIDENYTPETINLDGWNATNSAWKNLFPTISIIACFLHIYIKLRDRSKIKLKEFFHETADKLWNCYNATTKRGFTQRIRRLAEWSKSNSLPYFIKDKIQKLRNERKKFSIAYDYPKAHRTSNMLDRLMQKMDNDCLLCNIFMVTIILLD